MSTDEFKNIDIVSIEEKGKNQVIKFIRLYQSDEILFDKKSEYHINDTVLKLVNYEGGLGLPKSAGFVIIGDVLTDVSGYLGSPAYIQGMGSLNLIVDPNLELIVKNSNPAKVDGQMLDPDADGWCDYSYGRDFSEIKRNFYTRMEFSKPKLYINNDAKYAQFKPESEMADFPNILICKKENVAYIRKWSGTTNLYYMSDIEKEYVGSDEVGLRAQLTKAIEAEKYEEAEILQKKLNRILKQQNKIS